MSYRRAHVTTLARRSFSPDADSVQSDLGLVRIRRFQPDTPGQWTIPEFSFNDSHAPPCNASDAVLFVIHVRPTVKS